MKCLITESRFKNGVNAMLTERSSSRVEVETI